MNNINLLNKKEGETPLECLERFRVAKKIPKETKMTYAGRLDPMAHGALLVLSGEEVKNKESYLKLDKEYDFEVLFGFSTDTYDILGKILQTGYVTEESLGERIKNNLKYFKGKFVQKYPLYSSKTVKGKQLFEYGREGEAVELPNHEVEVASIKFIKLKRIDSKKLLQNIQKRIKKVKGDFRQKEILEAWTKYLRANNLKHFFIADFSIKCTSGTYVRGIANSLGEKIRVPATAFSIKRTRIGKWQLGGVK